jgi:hypothetical protein
MASINEITDKSSLLTLFEDIKAKIIANIPEITEVVVYSSQLDNEDTQRPFAYPYVALEINIDWDMSEAHGSYSPVAGAIGNQRKGDAIIIVHTLFGNRNDDTKTFTDNEPIRHRVHRAVDLLDNDIFFTPLLKTRDELPILFNSVQDYRTAYVCSVVEGALIIGTGLDLPQIDVNDLEIT